MTLVGHVMAIPVNNRLHHDGRCHSYPHIPLSHVAPIATRQNTSCFPPATAQPAFGYVLFVLGVETAELRPIRHSRGPARTHARTGRYLIDSGRVSCPDDGPSPRLCWCVSLSVRDCGLWSGGDRRGSMAAASLASRCLPVACWHSSGTRLVARLTLSHSGVQQFFRQSQSPASCECRAQNEICLSCAPGRTTSAHHGHCARD